MWQTFGPRTSGLKGEWLDPPLLSNFVDVYLFNSNWLLIVLDSPIKQFPTGWGRNGWKKQPRFMFIDLSRWRWWQGLKYMKGVKSNKCALVGVSEYSRDHHLVNLCSWQIPGNQLESWNTARPLQWKQTDQILSFAEFVSALDHYQETLPQLHWQMNVHSSLSTTGSNQLPQFQRAWRETRTFYPLVKKTSLSRRIMSW